MRRRKRRVGRYAILGWDRILWHGIRASAVGNRTIGGHGTALAYDTIGKIALIRCGAWHWYLLRGSTPGGMSLLLQHILMLYNEKWLVSQHSCGELCTVEQRIDLNIQQGIIRALTAVLCCEKRPEHRPPSVCVGGGY
jgi:hypothetical protein